MTIVNESEDSFLLKRNFSFIDFYKLTCLEQAFEVVEWIMENFLISKYNSDDTRID